MRAFVGSRPKKNNLVSFFSRYRSLIAIFAFSLALTLSDKVFGLIGTIVYLPMLLSGAVLAALLVIHWKWPETIDHDNHSGFFEKAWRGMAPRERVYANLGVTCVLILVAGIIAAALIK